MKALIVSEDESLINRTKKIFENCGFDTIIYRWLLKAMDNVEEISPHLIFINVRDYPRHWKTFIQYTFGLKTIKEPKIILCIDKNFSLEEQKKAQALHINAVFPNECSDDELKTIIKNLIVS